ncbi:MFS transporter [Mesorhizobium sp. BR1-1-12]|nr:MDR family MFS transporter [Mesorhizobium sp. BR1-1-12]MBZ9970570.1 MFS transporter [Mesorhizobium sp. BR1-1-12]
MDQAVDNQAVAAASAPLTESEKNAIIGGVLLSMLLAALDQTIVAPAMPTIARALGHAEYLPWIVTGYLLTATAMAPLYGKISDVYGRRPTVYGAILIFLAGSLVSAMAPNMFVLVIGRAIQGAGGGGLFALAQTVIGDLVPPRERARYAAWISGTWAVASIAGPLLGGTFAEHLHWSLIFWINIPLGILAMAIINKPLRKLPVAARRHRIDGLGALLLVAATALLLLALNWGGSEYPWLSTEILGLVASSLVLWGAFALRLLRATEPLISLEVLSNPIVLAGTLSMFLLQAANIGLSVYLPVYLQSVIGLSASESGTALLGLMLGTVAGATFSGRTIPRFVHYKRIAIFGLAFAVLCLGALSLVAGHASLLVVEILTTCVGLGSGTTFPVATVSVQNAVDPRHLGVATGVLTFLRSLGSALGVAILGAVALGNGLPLAGEGAQATGAGAEAAAFGLIFVAAVVMLIMALLTLSLMPEKPLRGHP